MQPAVRVYTPQEIEEQQLTLRDLLDQRKMRAMQMEQEGLKLNETKRSLGAQERIRQILASTPDLNKAVTQMYGVDPATAINFRKSLTEQEKAQTDLTKTQNEVGIQDIELRGRLAGSVRAAAEKDKPAAWQRALAYARSRGKDVSGYPAEYNEQAAAIVEQEFSQALSAAAQEQARQWMITNTREQTKFDLEKPGIEAQSKLRQLEAQGNSPVQPAVRLQLDAEAENRAQRDRHHADSIATTRRGQNMVDARAKDANATAATNKAVTTESQLRDDYTKGAGTFVKVRDGYERLLNAGKLSGGPADIAFVFAFMKTIDPDSAVLPGEAANAQNAGSVPEAIRAKYNQILSGEKLLPEVKKQFLEVAGQHYQSALNNYRSLQDQYTGIAQRSGANPQNVVVEHGELVVVDGETFKFDTRAKADAFRQALKMRKK
jgi:hypothetical protein